MDDRWTEKAVADAPHLPADPRPVEALLPQDRTQEAHAWGDWPVQEERTPWRPGI